MAAMEITGYLKLALIVNKQGALTKAESEQVQAMIIAAVKKEGLNLSGRFSFVQVETLEIEDPNTD